MRAFYIRLRAALRRFAEALRPGIQSAALATHARFKRYAEELQPTVSVIGGVASVVIAILAYMIDQNMQENARLEARINRSVAMARSIIDDSEFKTLQRIGHGIEWKAESFGNGPHNHSLIDFVSYQARRSAQLMPEQEHQFRFLVMRLLQDASRAQNCLTASDGDDPLCDGRSLMALAGGPLVEAFFSIRPILFCDASLKHSAGDLVTLVERHIADHPDDYAGASVEFDEESYCSIYTRALSEKMASLAFEQTGLAPEKDTAPVAQVAMSDDRLGSRP